MLLKRIGPSCCKKGFKNIAARYRQACLPSIPDAVWQSPWYFIAFGMGSGTLPWAPGTWGTLMAIPFYQFISFLSIGKYIIVLVCCTIFSIRLLENISQAICVRDHPGMCLDEFIGYFVTMISVPSTTMTLILGFILFRLFDICKPWPIYWLDQHVHGGLGMVLDDIVAGLYSTIILALIWNISLI